MKISFDRYPIDILLCIVWSIVLIPVVVLQVSGAIRVILGLPFIFIVPGYVLIFTLFPTRKTERGIDIIERIILSFGFSIVAVSLLGLGLNYTPWGIRLESIIFSILVFVIGCGTIASYRWFKTLPEERFILSLNVSLPKSESKLDKALTIILIASITITITFLIYNIVTPMVGEQFTDFYILGPRGIAEDYPTTLTVGENASVILGIVNHEGQTINYTIEVWLINQTTVFNETTQENESVYNNMWFIDKITVMLNHTPADIEKRWEPQWEYNYTVAINKPGENLKLQFLLFKVPTEDYNQNDDYHDMAQEKINSAYRETHFWVTVF